MGARQGHLVHIFGRAEKPKTERFGQPARIFENWFAAVLARGSADIDIES